MENIIVFETYNLDKKIPISKINQMLDILVPFYNKLNGKDNSTKEMCDPFINMIRNTKDYNILLCYIGKTLVGFVNYMYQDRGLMLSEIQIREEFQGKNILRKMIKKVIDDSDKSRYKDIYLTINPKNTKSYQVFTHIGFKNIENVLYKISYKEMNNWLNKKLVAHVDIENANTQDVITYDLDVLEYETNNFIKLDISKLNEHELEILKLAISNDDELSYTDIEMFFIGDSDIPEFGPDYDFYMNNKELIGKYKC